MDLEGIFSPLSKEYCVWFYYLQIFGFIFLVVILLVAFFSIISGKKEKKGMTFGFFMMILTYAIFYFQNRLLYSMCINWKIENNRKNYINKK